MPGCGSRARGGVNVHIRCFSRAGGGWCSPDIVSTVTLLIMTFFAASVALAVVREEFSDSNHLRMRVFCLRCQNISLNISFDKPQ